MILKVLEVEVGIENPFKIHHKSSSSWEDLLASIFHGFGWILDAKGSQVGTKNPIKIDLKRHQKRNAKK